MAWSTQMSGDRRIRAVFFAAREKGRLSDRTLAALEAYSAVDARRRGRSRMRENG
jgi:hypothetical protein